jgi:ABC-type multidrug transport system ATPase subunit
VLIGAGAKEVDVPDYLTARERFDTALCAVPKRQDRRRTELLEALGLRP